MGTQKKTAATARQVRVTLNALQNINEITGYIAFINHQPLNAIKAGDTIFETIDRIGQNPLAFKECQEIPTKTKIYRQASCFSWRIIYKVTSTEIVILGIIHGARKPSAIRKLKKVN
jgi:plasmid stabilization system protein ParE